ncbi:unnamed protein product [Durusdinium trenchii]|uniref:Uncharacterized protein n=1 Tax=Durusdinium trenchii TaxID=1381693 RepID=A0ABP0PCE8_9DINO
MFSNVLNNLADGFWCQSPKATVTDEVPLTTAEVLADEPLDGEDQWSDEELAKCFEQEACRIKRTVQNVDFEEVCTILCTRWLKRLSKDTDEKREGKSLRALLRSRALDILLSTLIETEVGRQAIYVAASTDPERESMDCSHISPAVPLRLLLYKGSDVPSVLMDSLLKLLSTVGRASTGLEDLHWVLLLLSAATLDASEVYVRRSRRGIDAIEKSAAEIRDMWKEMSQGIGEAATSAVKLGDAVWAEWPRNGRWFRGEVTELQQEQAMIKWLQRPSNVKGGQEDDYLVSVVGEDFDFEQSTAVINVAVLPAMFMRPQPIPEQEEDGWSQLMETAESLTNKYHQLRALFENLGKDEKPSERKKVADFERKKLAEATKALTATVASIVALRKDFDRRAQEANGMIPPFLSEALSIASDLETTLSRRLQDAQEMDGCQLRLIGMKDRVAYCCLDVERLRGRYLEELFNGLHSSIYGEDVAFLVQDSGSLQNIKNIISSTMKLSDQFWREAVQFAAESLDGPMASGCQEVSMAAKRYKELRMELKKIQERLLQVEKTAPVIPAGRTRKILKKGSSLGSQIAIETKGYLRTESQVSAVEEPRPPLAPAPEAFEVDFESSAAAAAFSVQAVPSDEPPQSPPPPQPAQPAPMPAAPKAVAPVEPPVELEQMERKVAPLDGVPKSAPPGCGQMLGRLSARCCGAS